MIGLLISHDYLHGHLLAKEICATTVDQQDVSLLVRTILTQILMPSIGQNVTVTGPPVLDLNLGWMEVLPVYSLVIL